MSRTTQSIEKQGDGESSQPAVTHEPAVVAEAPLKTVSMHYPSPTPLSKILKDVAKWSDWSFIVSPDLDRHLQIISPRYVDVSTGMGLFQAAIESVGLRMVYLREDVVKISKQRKDVCI
ncbi:MAG: hypothetical protein AB8C84_10980 [Oligoflexales bacterium]